jgi:hypothetical protein
MKHLCEDCYYCKRITENLEGHTKTLCCKDPAEILGTVKICKDYCSKELYYQLYKMNFGDNNNEKTD